MDKSNVVIIELYKYVSRRLNLSIIINLFFPTITLLIYINDF